MSDFTLPPANTLVVGMTGSGKSTFALHYLKAANVACRFIFDDLGRAATRLGVTPAVTAAQCEAALSSRWCVFNPHRMFPGDTRSAFRWFCHWCYHVSGRGPGKKLLLVDEVWQWQDNFGIPRELSLVVQTGREENLELVSCTQLPHKVNASVTGQCTELVCFRVQEPLALRRVAELGADPAVVEKLPPGQFIAYNRMSGGKLADRVF